MVHAPLVGPTGQRPAEVAREDRVRDLVRKHGVENPLLAPLDRHRPVEHLATVENEARGSAGPQVWGDLRGDGARPAPTGQRAASPFNGERVSILLGGIADLAGKGLGWRLNDEVRRAVAGGVGRGVGRDKPASNEPKPRCQPPDMTTAFASIHHARRRLHATRPTSPKSVSGRRRVSLASVQIVERADGSGGPRAGPDRFARGAAAFSSGS